MSLIKVNSVLRSDSFDDRVCDDLSEVILNYLPLKDKFRYECVSKQFQRTVYERQYELDINQSYFKTAWLNSSDHLKEFECIVKKLSNIKTVVNRNQFSEYITWNSNLNNLNLDLIIKNCDHLNQFYCSFILISESMKESFFKTFGSKLKSIFVELIDFKHICHSISNIEEIDCKDEGLVNAFKHISRIKLNNLKKLSMNIDWPMYNNIHYSFDGMSQSIQTMFDYNRNITHFKMCASKFGQKLLEPLFKGLSQLNILVHLELKSYIKYSIESVINGLKIISRKCPKLKSLSISYSFEVTEESQLIEFLRQFKEFKELKRLEIKCRFTGMDSPLIEFCSENYFKSGFENLTHLFIFTTFTFSDLIFEEKLLEDIDIHLPKLQKLVIKTAIKVTEQTVNTLCRLKNLETLDLNINYNSFRDSFESKMTKRCRKIKSIKLYYRNQ